MPQRPHVALLGDSIFDNAAYTSGAPDVATHLRRIVAPDWDVSLLPVDGATVAALESQLHDALELRSICTEPADYANAIEPSGQGGLKIAAPSRSCWEPSPRR
jgi:hypothetical protein